MDFSQTKLSKMEWESIEIPVAEQEAKILHLIMQGYQDINIKQNDNQSLLSMMKIEYTPEIEMYLYSKYFEPEIQAILSGSVVTETAGDKNTKKKDKDKSKSSINNPIEKSTFLSGFDPKLPNISKFKPPKKIDLMRLTNMDNNLQSGKGAESLQHKNSGGRSPYEFGEYDKTRIFEFILLDFCKQITLNTGKDKGTGQQQQQQQQKEPYTFYLYTLIQMRKSAIPLVNAQILLFIDQMLVFVQEKHPSKILQDAFTHAHRIIEKNPYLLRYENKTLYDHQKQLFQLFRSVSSEESNTSISSKLVLYTAPTGTGKTMSPLGLSNGYRVIYICAARHIGLALAKSAVSMEKRVAFAFGCETAADIRLHYYAAAEYTKNRKTGGIFRVDNSNGIKVEIMICDVHSYLTAMHYMLAFHSEQEIVLYWDEPTITLDLESHSLHPIIQRNWTENKISNIVLSCATLPEEDEIMECLMDYRGRFDGGTVHRVSSYDCKKSISLMDPRGRPTLPHLLFSSYTDIVACVGHIEKNMSLLRYLDLREIVRMVEHVVSFPGALPEAYHVVQYFMSVADMTMNRIKMYYLDVLRNISPEAYPGIHVYLKSTVKGMYDGIKSSHIITKSMSTGSGTVTNTTTLAGSGLTRTQSVMAPPLHETNHNIQERSISMSQVPDLTVPLSNPFKGVLLTTEDAYTLTDGPTIFIVEDVQKISQFYIQQSRIPMKVLDNIMEKIEANNVVQKKMDILMKSIDDSMGKEAEKEKKMEKEAFKPEVKRMLAGLDDLREHIKMISMGMEYIPNTRQHQHVWTRAAEYATNAFTPQIDETSVRKIMELDVDNSMKLLLLMGVGVFDTIGGGHAYSSGQPEVGSDKVASRPEEVQKNMLVGEKSPGIASYMEVMRRLAYEQKLFLIIASSDYIYGTNYQLCHGFLGRDLLNMTQQKIIQAMGRIGRSNIQQEYTIRFRDEGLMSRLFLPTEGGNMEAINMGRLLCG